MIGRVLVGVALAAALAGCGEKPQRMEPSTKTPDTRPWAANDSAVPAFNAPGWNGGDRAAWDKQIHDRTQGQNDYAPR